MRQRKSKVAEQRRPTHHSHRFGRCLFILLPLAILLSRLPFLLNDSAYLDGDESLYGIMTLHFLEGKGLPILPYGQGYGVSVIETLVMAVFAWLLGLTPTVMQLSMLSLWALAVTAFALAARRFAGDLAAAVATALLVSSPGWGHVSLASWGYNQTAFLATNISLWLIAGLIQEDRKRSPGLLFALGLSVGIASVTQPIYALALSPFLWLAVRGRRLPDGFYVALGFAIIASLFVLLRALDRVYWQPQLFEDPDVIASLWLMPHRLWVVLSGAYVLDIALPVALVTVITATLWSLCALALAIRVVLRSGRNSNFTASHACILAVVLVLLFSLAVTPVDYGYRYGLPAVGFICLALGIELAATLQAKQRTMRMTACAILAIFLFGGSVSLVELGRLNFSGTAVRSGGPEGHAIQTLVDYLLRNQIQYVFCPEGMFQWKLIFVSRERIKTRWFDPVDRYPAYAQAVDQALFSGQPVAIVHEAKDVRAFTAWLAQAGFGYLKPEFVADRYIVLQNPPQKLLDPWFQNSAPGRQPVR